MPHLLFSRHSIEKADAVPPTTFFSLWLSVHLPALTEQKRPTCIQLQGLTAARQAGDVERLGWRLAAHLADSSALPELPGVRWNLVRARGDRGGWSGVEWSSANIYAPTHTLAPNQYVFKCSHTPPHTAAR